MKLLNFEYTEYPNSHKCWNLQNAEYQDINLIVGKNSTGKSRLLSVISSLSNLILGKIKSFESGVFTATIEIKGSIYKYHINFSDSIVKHEYLIVDDIEKFNRNENGEGKIFFTELNQFVNFRTPSDSSVASTKQDEIQHPYIIMLKEWANSVLHLKFGSEFGHRHLVNITDFDSTIEKLIPYQGMEVDNILPAYVSGYKKFGDEFDQQIITDMKSMGYELSDVGACDIQQLLPFPFSALTLYVQEKDLNFKVPQTQLSQGMFRALALSIHLNLCAFEKSKGLLLVDDIGEGLDFERATSVIDLVSKKSEKHEIQIIMTSNDRFVMNKVPLKNWVILKRNTGTIKLYNYKNSREKFDEFKFIGLNNLDFFTSNFFLEQEE